MTTSTYNFTTATDVKNVLAGHADRFDTSAAWERACRAVWREASYRGGVWRIDCELADALMDLAVEAQVYEERDRDQHRVSTAGDRYRVVTPAGNPVYTTDGALFLTDDLADAETVARYLSQRRRPRRGTHRLKSMFGKY